MTFFTILNHWLGKESYDSSMRKFHKLEKLVKKLTKENSELLKANKELQSNSESLKSQIKDKGTIKFYNSSILKIEDDNGRLSEVKEQADKLEEELANAKNRNKSLVDLVNKLETKYNTLIKEFEKLEEEKENADFKIKKLSSQVDEIESNYEAKIEKLKEQLKEFKSKTF